jgi:hypothetical protein
MLKNLTLGIPILAFAISAQFAISALAVAPINASPRAAARVPALDIAAERIGIAFASLPETEIDPGLVAAAARASKGDLVCAGSCAGATWPDTSMWRRLTADRSSALHVRAITIGYQTSVNTTLLVRVPLAEVAKRWRGAIGFFSGIRGRQ